MNENVNDTILLLILDPDGQVRFFNFQSLSTFKTKPEILAGMHLYDSLHPEDQENFGDLLHCLKRHPKKEFSRSYRLKVDYDKWIQLDFSFSTMVGADKEFLIHAGARVSNCWKFQKGKFFARKEEQLSLITSNIRDLVYRISILPNGKKRLHYISEPVNKILGIDQQAFKQNLPEIKSFYHPDDLERIDEFQQKVVSTQTPGEIIYRFFHRKLREYRWIEEFVVPEYNKKGHIVGTFGTARDVTERVHAEQKLDLLAAMVKHSADAIFSVCSKLSILSWNKGAEEIFGYNLDEIKGLDFYTLFSPSDVPPLIQLVNEKGLGEGMKNRELVLQKKSGEKFPANITFSPMKNSSGEITGHSVVIRDITDQKSLTNQLEISIQEKEVLLQEVHHRVKNNLQIISSLFILQLNETSDKQTRALLEGNIQRIRALAIVHEKLYLSPNLTQINLRDYISELLDNLISSFSHHNSQVKIKLDSENILLDINKCISCGIIINELVSNSFKHAFPEGKEGSIHVGIWKSEGGKAGGHVHLLIQDTGIGLKKELKLEEASSLGLTLVHSMIHQINGKITVMNARGAGFKISFPEKAGRKNRPA